MSVRDDILKRLREAQLPPAERAPLPEIADRDVFADFPEDLTAGFRERLDDLHAEFYEVQSVPAAAACLGELLAAAGVEHGLRHEGPLLDRLIAESPELSERLAVQPTLDSPAMAAYDVGVTEARCLIARTGSVLVRTVDAGGRRLSVLPPWHVVVARRSQLVASLDDAYRDLDSSAWSCAALISGPARTADIEKVLVLGAHGPKRLVVILISEA